MLHQCLDCSTLYAATLAACPFDGSTDYVVYGVDDGTAPLPAGQWVPTARSMPPPSAVVTRFASGHGWTGGTADTSTFLYGTQSYRGTTNGSGSSLYLESPTFSPVQNWSAKTIRLVLRVDNLARLDTLQVNVTHGSGNAVSATVQGNVLAGEWSILTLSRAQFGTALGTPNWANVDGIYLRIVDTGAGAVNVHVAAVDLIPDLAATYPTGVFILEADDGYAGHLSQLAPVVTRRGIPVTLNVISERFTGDAPTSGLDVGDLLHMQDKFGWQISCHAYAGSVHGPSVATASALARDFQRQKDWLHANGLHAGVDDYALCPGTGSPVSEGETFDALRAAFRSVRVNSGYYETALPADPLRLNSTLFTGNTNNQLQTNIDACAGAGGAFILALHDVISGGTNGTSNSLAAIAANNLATVLDYAATKGMVFRTRADWLDSR